MTFQNCATILSSAAAVAVIAIGTSARASITVVQQTAAAPTYANTLTFDEAGSAVGANVANNSWAGAPWNIAQIQSGEGSNDVADHSSLTGQGTNSYYGPFGVYVSFGHSVSAVSFQGWDDSGPSSPFGGGAIAAATLNGDFVELIAVTPAFGGVGKTWYNITTTGGSTFDGIAWQGNGFFPQSIIDNLSWTNAVPEPTSLALLGVAGLSVVRRRR